MIEGILFTDKISKKKKTLIKRDCRNIMDGKSNPPHEIYK
jgi:hypothetical protein